MRSTLASSGSSNRISMVSRFDDPPFAGSGAFDGVFTGTRF